MRLSKYTISNPRIQNGISHLEPDRQEEAEMDLALIIQGENEELIKEENFSPINRAIAL